MILPVAVREPAWALLCRRRRVRRCCEDREPQCTRCLRASPGFALGPLAQFAWGHAWWCFGLCVAAWWGLHPTAAWNLVPGFVMTVQLAGSAVEQPRAYGALCKQPTDVLLCCGPVLHCLQ